MKIDDEHSSGEILGVSCPQGRMSPIDVNTLDILEVEKTRFTNVEEDGEDELEVLNQKCSVPKRWPRMKIQSSGSHIMDMHHVSI